MLNPFKALIQKLTSKEEEIRGLEAFAEFEGKLKRGRPKPRVGFEQSLKSQLKARHQEMMEEHLESQFRFFRFNKFASVTAVLVFVIGGGALVVASPNPIPSTRMIADLDANQHPDVAPISIEFNQPMMQPSVEEAFSITPYIEGNFIWDGSDTLNFLPSEPFDINTEYTVTIATDAKSFFRKSMQQPYERTFTPLNVAFSAPQSKEFQLLEELRQHEGPFTKQEKLIILNQLIEMELVLDETFRWGDLMQQSNPDAERPSPVEGQLGPGGGNINQTPEGTSPMQEIRHEMQPNVESA